MEIVDIYDNKHRKINKCSDKHDLLENEYRLSTFLWIMNDDGEILIQKRSSDAKYFPDYWETVSGAVKKNEDALTGIIREVKEELGLSIDEEKIIYLGSYIRLKDFVEVYFLRSNINLDDVEFNTDEIQDVEWVKVEYFENMIKENLAVKTGYFLLKNYLEEVLNYNNND